jgi:glutamine amidotransferase
MKNINVTLVDYGIGNLYSVRRALEVCGAVVNESSDPVTLEHAERLVLPGVGAFADGIRELHERGLIDPLRRYAASGRPLLGICLGMQLLASYSDEFGHHAGLNIIPGKVVPIPAQTKDGQTQKTPHIGWENLLKPSLIDNWESSIFDTTHENTSVYLVHSFFVIPDNPSHNLVEYEYGGHRLCAAINQGNVFGTQFHPEKSGQAGLEILSRFLSCN